MSLRIGDLIDVPSVRTVIKLEEGRERSEDITGSFVFTSDVRAHFAVLSEALQRDTGKGYFLQGDFGSGKSHFLAALSAWFRESPGAGILTGNHPGLKRLNDTGRRFLPVDISLVNYRSTTPLEQIIISGIQDALLSTGFQTTLTPLANFIKYFREILQSSGMTESFAADQGISPQALEDWLAAHPRKTYIAGTRFLKSQGMQTPEVLVEERHETFAHTMRAVREAGFDGLVLLIDELSEFFRAKPNAAALNEDARTLQFLGELTGSEPLWIIAAIQESIERTGDMAQVTFRKIKDRFPIRWRLSTMHIRDLISKRLVRRKPGADERIHRIYENYKSHFTSFCWDYDLFRNIYPLHPITLALLEGLGDLFSQHRGIVDFVHSHLAGNPDKHIGGILERSCMELLAPDSIYEHFKERFAEFSAFNIYPRHIVPHLDEVVQQTIPDRSDRVLARRLIRILVLYKIHPTADPPKVRVLAELAACMLASHDPDLNTQFVAEALLDPIVEKSRFLVKKMGDSADPLDLTYTVITKDDPAKLLKNKISQVAGELLGSDSRLVTGPLAELPASVSWPGMEILQGVITRTLTWRHTVRRVVITLLYKGMETSLQYQIGEVLRSGEADFAVIFCLDDCDFHCDHTAMWKIPSPTGEMEILREFLASRLVVSQLSPSNPADAPLIPLVEDMLKRIEPAVHQALLNLIYRGGFDCCDIHFEQAARDLKRFDRLLESAAEHLLEVRYPEFKDIAPHGIAPSPRHYHRLLDEFVVCGSITLREARTKGLTDAIESLTVPLGLTELRAGSYILSPDPLKHPFLGYVFALFRSSGSTFMTDILLELRTGPYGLPRDTALFLFTALAHCGVISLLRGGRTVPLDFLDMKAVESIDAIAPGEVIGQADRRTLLNECLFLAPGRNWESFGLRQQREAWQAVIKFKDKMRVLTDEIEKGRLSTAEYSALESFDTDSLRAELEALNTVLDEIKISYAAREGLERFLNAWRRSGLAGEDIDSLKKIHRFFTRFVEQFIFICHYMRHRSVENAVSLYEELSGHHQTVVMFLSKPEIMIVNDDGAGVASAFAIFRKIYLEFYRNQHAIYYPAGERGKLPKFAQRAVKVLRGLANIEPLDRPPGLERLLKELDAPATPLPCRRNLAEELLRSPICGCGFQIGDEPPRPALLNPAEDVETSLTAYLDILRSPPILEALTARAYALKDMDANTAERLRDFGEALKTCKTPTPVTLINLLNEQTMSELAHALSGNVTVEERPLSELITHLSGRRLTRRKIARIIEEWIAKAKEDTIISIIEDISLAPESTRSSPVWWPLIHPDLFAGEPVDYPKNELRMLEGALEESFPAAKLQKRLTRLDNENLLKFLINETCHTHAIQTAWLILTERVLHRSAVSLGIQIESKHLMHTEAVAIQNRLKLLKRLLSLIDASLPNRLQIRLLIAEIMFDSWATKELQSALENTVSELDISGEDWLATLPPSEPLDIKDGPVILIFEAISPDVWLEATANGSITEKAAQTWVRLETEPKTVPSISAMFAFVNDPSDEFAARGILYHHVEGNESRPLVDLLPPFDPQSPVVIRLRIFDRAAHSGGIIRLCDMPGILKNILERQLPPIMERCSQQKRRLILTTDHGLTFSQQGLTHGKGGVYERAIFRAEWGWK